MPQILCKHLTEGTPLEFVVDDYHPLTKREIFDMLREVYGAAPSRFREKAAIQVRLNQALPGMTCPRPADGAVAAISAVVDTLYVNHLNRLGPVVMAEVFDVLMNPKENTDDE